MDNTKLPQVTDDQLAFATGSSLSLVRKVKYGLRTDRRGIINSIKEIQDFLQQKRLENIEVEEL